MKILIDTHVLLWALSDELRLSPAARLALLDPLNDVYVSAVTGWEIAVKQSLGKLTLPGPAETFLPFALEASGFQWLSITEADALRTRALPWHHRDPFDRMLVAQAMGGRTLVTADAAIAAYGIPILW